jgi:prepilin-type N-terminal cleavage/methylation domain-containing protein
MYPKHAFSLIELLAAIAIISILAASLVPSFNRAKSTAQRTICWNNLKQVSVLIRLYAE